MSDDFENRLLVVKILSEEHEVLVGAYELGILKGAQATLFELVIIDSSIPREQISKICRDLKLDWRLSHVPIVILSQKRAWEDIREIFDMGANDYLMKPFLAEELRARCNAQLKGGKVPKKIGVFTVGPLMFDSITRRVTIFTEGESALIKLSPTEFQLLLLLTKNFGKTLKRDEICRELSRDFNKNSDTRAIDVQINSIRKKSPFLLKQIQCVHGLGYRLASEV